MARLSRGETGVLVLLALTTVGVFAAVLLDAPPGGTWTASAGRAPTDQLEYLWWIRDAAEHALVSNRFGLTASDHSFLHPMFVFSGLLAKAGLSLQLSYLAWVPVAFAVLFAGHVAYVRRVESDARSRWQALLIALFFFTPAVPVIYLTHIGGPQAHTDIGLMGDELFSAGYLWGYLPRAIGVGLVPLFLLGAERIVDPGRRKPGRSAGWYTAWTAVAGLMAAWIHPWQGETLLLILLALAAWGRFERRYRGFALPALATAAPLVYYFALSRADNAWRHAAHETALPHYAGWLLIAGLAPLAAFAVPGALRAARDFQDRVLVLWPLAGLAVYLAVPSLSSHGLNGLSLPLAVLAVRGFTRLRLPQVATLAAVAALMLPGIVYVIRSARPSGSGTPRFLSRDETRALGSLASTGPPGPVLAPYELGTSVPAFTGRSTWIGHAAWTPDWALRFARTNALFYGRMPPAQARKLVRESGASVVLSDCRSRDLAAIIGASVSRPRHFGCVAVYRVRRESTSVHG